MDVDVYRVCFQQLTFSVGFESLMAKVYSSSESQVQLLGFECELGSETMGKLCGPSAVTSESLLCFSVLACLSYITNVKESLGKSPNAHLQRTRHIVVCFLSIYPPWSKNSFRFLFRELPLAHSPPMWWGGTLPIVPEAQLVMHVGGNL